MYDNIKKWYDAGVWTADMVRQAWLKGKITDNSNLSALLKRKNASFIFKKN